MICPQCNVNLQPFNTLSVPSEAEYFFQATCKEELIEAILWARDNQQPIKILSGGSNVLLKEKVHGLVVQPLLKGIKIEPIMTSDREVIVTAGAGENWHALVESCVNKSIFGLENLALIPGNVGSAPIQNIGAYGVELKDVFVVLTALNIETLETEVFDLERAEFAYRDSVFKRDVQGKYVILEVSLHLTRKPYVNLKYPALLEALQLSGVVQPTPLDVFNAVVKVRSEKLPDPKKIPNVGSFFKNPIVTDDAFQTLKSSFPAIVYYDAGRGDKKLAAAWLIDQAGWKGKGYKSVAVHDKQALVIVNPNLKPVDEILELAYTIEQSVLEKFGVQLEIEPRIIT